MNTTYTLLIRYGEIGLKKGNRYFFEKSLKRNIQHTLKPLGTFHIKTMQKRILLKTSALELEEVAQKISKIPGVVSVRPCTSYPSDASLICEQFRHYLQSTDLNHRMQIFAIRSTRTEKKFPLTSNDINRQLGNICLEYFPEWQVNLDEPAITFYVLVMKDKIHITHEDILGPGGLPVGTAGKLALLLSGGIDSPIAGYQMQRRGAHLLGVYFHSFPYTGDQALSKVKDLRQVLEQFQSELPLHVVYFTVIQEAIRDHCHAKYSVILNRRMMMRIAENIALKNHALGLITGESLGQVASQTLENMHAVGQATSLQIYRPLIGVDKQDITTSARRLGTFEISSRPFEDCCTLFVDKHPVIRADLDFIAEQEDKLDIPKLIKEALEKTLLVTDASYSQEIFSASHSSQ